MKVYVVEIGHNCEGSSVEGIYFTLNLAVAAANIIMSRWPIDDKWRKTSSEDGLCINFDNGYDYVQVSKMTVQSEVKS